MNAKHSQRSINSNFKESKPKQQQKIEEMPIEENQAEEDPDLSEDIEDQPDDQLNESLFERYDQMFSIYNNFGSMFQQTAHYIGLLIRKNMTLNHRVEELQDQLEQASKSSKANEEAYENLLVELSKKERKIEDLLGETASLKMQMEQLFPKKQSQQQQLLIPKRDILKEREEAMKRQQQVNQNGAKSPNLQSAQSNKAEKKEAQQHIGGTYETFFEIGKGTNQENDESCSLKDLFSLKNTKKRDQSELLKDNNEEDKTDKWITNKKKFKQKCEQDTQMANRFEQLSQAFFQIASGSNVPSNSFAPLQSSGKKNVNERESIGSIINMGNEDSASSVSLFNACIRFDAKSALQDSLKQSKLNFGNSNSNKEQKLSEQEKKNFEIQVVEQVSESLQEDFFTIKNEKKARGSNNSNAITSANSNKKISNARGGKKLV